jgi:GT2 family glycosyltransferase
MTAAEVGAELVAPLFVGEVELVGLRDSAEPVVSGGGGYPAARLLVTGHGVPLGLVTVPLCDGRVDGATVQAAAAHLWPTRPGPPPQPAVPPLPERWPLDTPSVTVTVATRDRPDSLARCLRSVLAAAQPDTSVLVVDNAPADDRTAALVAEEFGADPRVRYVLEPRAGLSVARNRALAETDSEVLLFTDDDVEVDVRWVGRHLQAYLRDPALACVTGAVFAARLDTAEEVMSDGAIAWSKGLGPVRYQLDEPPAGVPIFPFSPGLFGTGANFSVRTDVARALGGFDEALGAGAPTRGGEDCDFFVRLLLVGQPLGYQPAAYLWHHHRPSPEAFRGQMRDYGTGLAAWLTKVALDPTARPVALRRAPGAVRHLFRLHRREAGAGVPMSLSLLKVRGAAAGPIAYLRARRVVRRAGRAGSRPGADLSPQ